jgi:hypothetical protein
VWGDLITNRSVRIVTTGQLIDESAGTAQVGWQQKA